MGAQRRRATDGETVRCEQRPTCLCIAWGWCMARRAEPSLARIACGGAQPCNCRHRHHGRSGPTRPPETCLSCAAAPARAGNAMAQRRNRSCATGNYVFISPISDHRHPAIDAQKIRRACPDTHSADRPDESESRSTSFPLPKRSRAARRRGRGAKATRRRKRGQWIYANQ